MSRKRSNYLRATVLGVTLTLGASLGSALLPSGSAYAAGGCGKPQYNANTANGIYIWRECGNNKWHLRAYSGANFKNYAGNMTADKWISNVKPYNLESSDELSNDPRKRVDFDLKVTSPWEDGFDFTVLCEASVTFSLASGSPIFVGVDRANVAAPFNLTDYGSCGGGTGGGTGGAAPYLTVNKSSTARVEIDQNKTIRPSMPRELFSANMGASQFSFQLWNSAERQLKPQVTTALSQLNGSLYRYPGGLISNGFDWEASVQPYDSRLSKYKFGLDEYLQFIKDLSEGAPWFTLNLIGNGTHYKPIELSSSNVAEINKNLARHIKDRTPGQAVRYYHLGNELDRNIYEWSPSKYVSRSRDTINAIQSIDPSARFIPFMREYDWRYKSGGVSKAQDYFNSVMRGLPMIKDIGLQFYYDGQLSPSDPYVAMPKFIEKVQKALTLANNARKDNYSVWITEHAKRFYLGEWRDQGDSANSLSAAVSVGDFLLSMMQIKEVKGVMSQGLEGGDREMFYDDMKETSPHVAKRILAKQPYPRVLTSQTYSPNKSGYKGGYDVRALGFTNDAGNRLAVSAINRSRQGTTLSIQFPPLKGKTVKMKHYYVRGAADANAANIERNYQVDENPVAKTKSFDGSGKISVLLPPSSISTLVFE